MVSAPKESWLLQENQIKSGRDSFKHGLLFLLSKAVRGFSGGEKHRYFKGQSQSYMRQGITGHGLLEQNNILAPPLLVEKTSMAFLVSSQNMGILLVKSFSIKSIACNKILGSLHFITIEVVLWLFPHVHVLLFTTSV